MAATKRSPKLSSAELHALFDGCNIKWNILRSNVNSDQIVTLKKQAWEAIAKSVNTVNITGTTRKWQDLRRKVQVEKSNVKRKIQEIRRKRGITGNTVAVPDLTELEQKVATILTAEEIMGIDGSVELGGAMSVEEVVTLAGETEAEDRLFLEDLESDGEVLEVIPTPRPTSSSTNTTTISKPSQQPKKRKTNAFTQEMVLKLQYDVLKLQKEYYSYKLAKLQE